MTLLVGFLRSLFIHRETLILENLALRQQLAAYKRTCKRPRLRMFDRAFWVGLSKLWRKWSTARPGVPSENTIRRGSSGSTLVPMVQSPDLGERDDLSGISVVDRPWIGRILLER